MNVTISDIQAYDTGGHALADETRAIVREALEDLEHHGELPQEGHLVRRHIRDTEVVVVGNRAGYYQVTIEYHRGGLKAANPTLSCVAVLR